MVRIGIIGAGLMGSSTAKCLASKGHDVLVYNRTRSKAEKLCKEIGCKVVDYPRELGDVDYILVFVLDDNALFNIVFSREGLMSIENKDIIIVNASTITPMTSELIYKVLRDKGITYVEAPVYGSVDEALNCSLLSMVSCEEKIYGKAVEFIKEYSSEIIYVGEIPKAMALKLSLNNIGLSMPPIIGESLALLEAYNVDLSIFLNVSSKLWFGKILERYLNRIMKPSKHVRFTTHGASKDYRLITRTLITNNYPSIISSALMNYYSAATKEYGKEDYPKAAKWILKKNK